MLRFLLPIFLVSSFYAHASLHGSYTIDPSKKASASNYTSFNDAADDLLKGVRSVGSANGPGVSAAVTFNIADGMYNERVTITSVKGASGKNSITFQSASGDSSKVILMDSTTGSPGFVLHLKNASHIRFNRITLKRGGNGNAYTYSDYVILIDSVSDSNTIANCVIRGLFTSGTNYYSALVYSGLSGGNYTTDEHDSFENNYLTHGYYGMMIEGNYSYGGQEGGNVIDHNTMDTLGNYGIYGSYQYGLIITNNKIDMSFGNYGIYLQETNQYNSTPVSRILNNFLSYQFLIGKKGKSE